MKIKLDKGVPVFGKKSWVFRIVIGPGAGYIGGLTIFFACNSSSLRWLRQFRGGKPVYTHRFWEYTRILNTEVGITQNFNLVPHIAR